MLVADCELARNRKIYPALFNRAILLDQRLNRSMKLLATAVATIGGGAPCPISTAELCRLCGFNDKTWSSARRELERLGYITTERVGNGVPVYTIALPEKEGRS